MAGKRVLSVGQCGIDHGQLAHSLREMFDVEVIAADNEAKALRQLGEMSFALVLVNRVFDVDGASGIDFLRRFPEHATVPRMLVSNYEDAQAEAVATGALPGFGKSALGRSEMRARLEKILGETSGSEA